ncbi:hypothetical protein SBOR_0744 [Sclerotinia borealis F-4128]|uniref:Haloacid dehalogenase-like hydrolase n=1 Tax=Sclerotinia borealis (strain F-4128) TaxID=1432307 RepID=W9CSR7_SCLBF|nr:hypothetical protein SBOR_0744 [Sclerotinia borealis F-4128]
MEEDIMKPEPKPTQALSIVRPMDERFTHFIFDFDGTITTKDTINVIANIGIAHQHNRGKKFTRNWANLVKSYLDEFDNHTEKYIPKPFERTTLEEEIKFQRSLKDVELRSFNRVSTSGLFVGISKEQWEHEGKAAVLSGKVEIRRGFKELVKEIELRNGVWGIVSVNFSKDFIRGVLEQCLEKRVNIPILANSLDEHGIICGPVLEETGLKTVLATSDTKLSAMLQLLKSWKHDDTAKAVYYGDSPTDLECLFDPAVKGVVVGQHGNTDLLRSLLTHKDPQLVETYTRDFDKNALINFECTLQNS